MAQRLRAFVTTSWDDGHEDDLKTAELLAKLGIRATFYVAPRNRERAPLATAGLRELASKFELGGHTCHHVRLPGLSEEEVRSELHFGRQELENAIGKPVDMFCYPGGRYTPAVVDAVKRAGYRGARTTRQFWTDVGCDAWRLPSTLHAFPHRRSVRIRHSVRIKDWRGAWLMLDPRIGGTWVDTAVALFERVRRRGGVWHLWGHSWEIQERRLWSDLTRVLSFIANRDDVAYVTNSELVPLATNSNRCVVT